MPHGETPSSRHLAGSAGGAHNCQSRGSRFEPHMRCREDSKNKISKKEKRETPTFTLRDLRAAGEHTLMPPCKDESHFTVGKRDTETVRRLAPGHTACYRIQSPVYTTPNHSAGLRQGGTLAHFPPTPAFSTGAGSPRFTPGAGREVRCSFPSELIEERAFFFFFL